MNDTYNLEALPNGRDGYKQLTLLDPNDPVRGNQAYNASRVGYYLAGWYLTKTEVTDNTGKVIDYTYSDRWDFSSNKYEIPINGTYDNKSPVLTLYAAWVPAFTYEFYSVNEDGSITPIGTMDVDPTKNTPITVPAINAATGAMDANDFPSLSKLNKTYAGIYLDEFCNVPVTEGTITHSGYFNADNATVSNSVMRI